MQVLNAFQLHRILLFSFLEKGLDLLQMSFNEGNVVGNIFPILNNIEGKVENRPAQQVDSNGVHFPEDQENIKYEHACQERKPLPKRKEGQLHKNTLIR